MAFSFSPLFSLAHYTLPACWETTMSTAVEGLGPRALLYGAVAAFLAIALFQYIPDVRTGRANQYEILSIVMFARGGGFCPASVVSASYIMHGRQFLC